MTYKANNTKKEAMMGMLPKFSADDLGEIGRLLRINVENNKAVNPVPITEKDSSSDFLKFSNHALNMAIGGEIARLLKVRDITKATTRSGFFRPKLRQSLFATMKKDPSILEKMKAIAAIKNNPDSEANKKMLKTALKTLGVLPKSNNFFKQLRESIRDEYRAKNERARTKSRAPCHASNFVASTLEAA
jgi:hypothetical protein